MLTSRFGALLRNSKWDQHVPTPVRHKICAIGSARQSDCHPGGEIPWRSHPTTTRSPDINSRGSSTSTNYCHSSTGSMTSAADVTRPATASSTSTTIAALILLFLLNPVLRSFRALQHASLLEQVRRKVGCSRTSLGSLSEAVEILRAAAARGDHRRALGRGPTLPWRGQGLRNYLRTSEPPSLGQRNTW